jgi:hypothetical protein
VRNCTIPWRVAFDITANSTNHSSLWMIDGFKYFPILWPPRSPYHVQTPPHCSSAAAVRMARHFQYLRTTRNRSVLMLTDRVSARRRSGMVFPTSIHVANGKLVQNRLLATRIALCCPNLISIQRSSLPVSTLCCAPSESFDAG